ncbi:MAG TPA: histidine phosphatase family protein [Gallionella sp.]|jgi:phosphohistidine phosphatase|nr:MAG: histidine phosphatase family protein [Gallionellales bacterium GWA2_54_124]OGT20005.1 MAG: histidine phosphatase family protein [Gallionellales bacterium RIFOXYD12_FULL_53_10]HCI54008.1 histidine phosphatase family protein [Gallionella sp.]
MDIILWRHAEAEEGSNDLARQLTEKGRKQAAQMAEFLHRHLPVDTRILVSPAVRTQQTASALTKDFITAPSIAPDASPHAVLQAARWPNAGGTVLIIGHQPTLGSVAAQLLGSGHESLRIKKSGLWWLSRRESSSATTLRLVITPDYL